MAECPAKDQMRATVSGPCTLQRKEAACSQETLARVSGRVVVVVVVVRELFSLMTSAICVRIRGQRLRRLFTT